MIVTELSHLTDKEVGLRIAGQLRAWRIDPRGAGMTLDELSRRSGMGLTPLRRFEKTGGITLRNLIALMRAMGMLGQLVDLIPAVEAESPMEILERERRSKQRKRAPRAPKKEERLMALEAPEAPQMKRFGFLAGQIRVPDDVDTMGSDVIQALFEGDAATGPGYQVSLDEDSRGPTL